MLKLNVNYNRDYYVMRLLFFFFALDRLRTSYIHFNSTTMLKNITICQVSKKKKSFAHQSSSINGFTENHMFCTL